MSTSHELMVLVSLIALYTVWVVWPLIPAVLIYSLFPNTAVAVSGPLAQLTVRASGAFAGYLVVFLVSIPLVHTTEEAIGGFQHPFWVVTGKMKLVDREGKELQSEDLLSKVGVRTQPLMFTLESYIFRWNIPESGDGSFPWVIIEIPGFEKNVINLQSDPSVSFDKDDFHKSIVIKTPITMKQSAVPASYDTRPQRESAKRAPP